MRPAVVARTLSQDGHVGGDYVLTGPESLTQEEQVRIIGEAASQSVPADVEHSAGDAAPEVSSNGGRR